MGREVRRHGVRATMTQVQTYGRGTRTVTVYKGVVVIGEAGDESSDASRDVLGVSVVLKILMVRIDRDWVRGSH